MKQYFYNDIPTDYYITENGEVYSRKSNQWLKGSLNSNGYLVYTIYFETGKCKKLMAHRMVMETFQPIENSKNYVVNHKDFNPLNNNVNNLEWCTQSENVNYSKQEGRYLKRPIYAFNDNKEIVFTANKLEELKELGYSIGSISFNAKQKNKIKINGYYWSYEKSNDFTIITIPNTGNEVSILQYDRHGNFIACYESMASAAKAVGGTHSHISEACNGKIKSYKGYIWKKAL